MREIAHGKRIGDGRWVYGYLCTPQDLPPTILKIGAGLYVLQVIDRREHPGINAIAIEDP